MKNKDKLLLLGHKGLIGSAFKSINNKILSRNNLNKQK